MGNNTIKGLVNVVGELQQNGKPVATEEYVDEKGIHYFDKFVTGEKLDEQMTIGQIAYCDYGSIVVGGDVPSSVVIKFTQSAARAIYLRNIYIRYVDTNNVEQTYDYTFTSKQFSQVGQVVDLNGLDWRVEDPNTSLYFGNSNTYGQQFGSSSQWATNLTLTTVDLAGCTVKEVRITACGASSTNAKLYVKAAGDDWLYHEGESGESTFKVLSANTTSDPATFTYGEGSTPGTGETIPFSQTFVKRVNTEALLDPIAPIESVVYVNLGDNRLYRYDGTTLVELSKVLELGTTNTTAYRGDLGSDNRSRIFDILNNKLPNSNLEEITWLDLRNKRDNGGLTPGKSYRITDYQCTTIEYGSSSAGHVFDIIVVADSTNKLNEVARACLHSGDTYFASNKLEAWQLWYCIDNDKTRFAWADETNGKGIIYRMIDEFDNDVPYDFKNILFTSATRGYSNAYTFSYTEDSAIKDASLLGLSKGCYSNVIGLMMYGSGLGLNFNVFYSTSSVFGCHGNTLGSGCRNNTFGSGCRDNTFDHGCSHNTFGLDCAENTFGNQCSSIVFGNGCSNNTFGIFYSSITFGSGCQYNTFGTSSSPISYGARIILDNSCRYLYIDSADTSGSFSNYLQNVHVHTGVSGSSSSNRKTITIPDRNLQYTTDVYPIGSTEMFV